MPPGVAVHVTAPRFRVIRARVVYVLCWAAACFAPLLVVGLSPLAALGLATSGGLLLGWETGRGFEGGLAREPLAEASSGWATVWHWLVVGAIGLNYAWFVFKDRPFVPGALLLITLIVVRWIRTRSLFASTPLDLPIVVLLFLVVIFSAVISVRTSLSYPKLYGVAFGILLFYEIVNGVQQTENLTWWLIGLHFLGLAIAGLGMVGTNWFLEKLVDLSEVYALLPRNLVSIPRSLRGGFHPNGIAGTLIYLIPAYAVMLKGRSSDALRLERLYGGLAVLTLSITVLTLLLTQSRGALTSLLIASIALFFALKGRFRLSLLAVLCLLLLSLLFLAYLPDWTGMPEATRQRATRYQLLQSFRFRQETWRLGLKVLEAFPLGGAGIGTFDQVGRYTFPNLYPNLYPRNLLRNRRATITHAHNEFLQVAIDLGLPGFVAYVALWAAFVRTAWRVYTWAPDEGTRRIALGIAAGLLAHQIFGLTDAFLLGTKPGIVMWILMGIITGMYLNLAPAKPGIRNDECGMELQGDRGVGEQLA